MGIEFFLVCTGVLGCYAVFRTTKSGKPRACAVLALIVLLIQIGFDALFPPSPAGSRRAEETTSFISRKAEQIENDRCMMSHLEDSPLSSLAYLMEMHKFLREMKQLQTPALRDKTNLTIIERLVQDTFGEEAKPASPRLLAANASGGSLCERFTRWVSMAEVQSGLTSTAHLPQAPSIPSESLPLPLPDTHD